MAKEHAGTIIGEYLLQIPLTEAEIAQKQSEYFETDLEILRAQEELERAKAIYKEKTLIPLKIMGQLRTDLRNGFVEKDVRAYEHIDEDTEMVEYYEENDTTGEPILKRPMTRKEKRDLQIKFNKRAAY